MYCATCDRTEHDHIGLDTETCMRCGGNLCQPDDDEQLTVDHRPDWKQDQAETSRLRQLGVTPDNFDQLLSDVLADMNADDEAAAAATTQKDDSF